MVYKQDEVKKIKQEFWTTFGVLMKKHEQLLGVKVNWLNFDTKCKYLTFRKAVDNKKGLFAIEISAKDATIRELFYLQLQSFVKVLTDDFPFPLIWQADYLDEHGVHLPRAFCVLDEYGVYNKAHWSVLFDFFEQCSLAAYAFWENTGEVFKELEANL